MPKASRKLMPDSRTIPGHLWGCCASQRSSTGRSSLARASSERPHTFLKRTRAANAIPNVSTWRSTCCGLPESLATLVLCPKKRLPRLHCLFASESKHLDELHKFALNFHHHNVVAIEAGDGSWRPVLREKCELLCKVNLLVHFVFLSLLFQLTRQL